jgi:hypothetical protein
MWRQGFGSNHVDFGGKISYLSALSKMVEIGGDLTKNTGSVWSDKSFISNIIEGINLIGF